MGHIDTQFQVIEVKSESGKDYYLEGFVSTTDPDLVNDVVTEKAQRSIISQLNNRPITVDDNHDSHRDKNGKVFSRTQHKMPLGLITEAEMRKTAKGSIGTWVRAKLNKDYPMFKEYLSAIKNKFVHSYSIAYSVTKAVKRAIGNKEYRIIDDLNILNIGATGTPVNGDATFDLALKSFNIKMVQEEKIQELEASIAQLKSSNESLTKENVQLKNIDKGYKEDAKKKEVKADEDAKKKKEEADKKADGDKKEMKSLNDKFEERMTALETENAQYKSYFEKPQLKSLVEAKSQDPNAGTQDKKIDAWSMMS